MKKRKIVVYTDYKQTTDHYKGTFHQFGCGYREFESGAALFTTAIIEKEDGTLRSEPVDLCRFTKEETS